MIFNNGFPATYQPLNYGFQPYQQTQQPQQMTPPTIRAEIIQVEDEEAANNYPVGAGASQMMIAKDDSAIYVKTALANGGANLDVFVKRPKSPPKPPFDPDRYVTRDEFEMRLQALFEADTSVSTPEKRESER